MARPDNFGEKFADGGGYYDMPCATCVHKHLASATCDAFPDGIPKVILDGKFKHRTTWPGDHGIVYQEDTARLRRLQPFLEKSRKPFQEPDGVA